MGLLCGLQHYNHANQNIAEGVVTVGGTVTGWGWWTRFGWGSNSTGNPEIVPGYALNGIITSTFTDLVVYIDDVGQDLAQDAFTSITVEDGDGVERTYNTADASLFSWSSGLTFWQWATVPVDPVWGILDVSETHPWSIK